MLAATFLAASSTLTSAAMTTAPFTNSSRWDPRTYQHKEKLTFEQLGSAIRLVVLACKRPLALNALLENLDSVGEAGGYEKFQVPLLISIDVPRGQLTAPDDVVGLANDFKWNYGQKSVRVQPTHQGILGQWLGLRTDVENPWMAILEDDLALSPCFYSYLLRGNRSPLQPTLFLPSYPHLPLQHVPALTHNPPLTHSPRSTTPRSPGAHPIATTQPGTSTACAMTSPASRCRSTGRA